MHYTLVTVSLNVSKGNIWTWTKQRLAWILRTIPERIPSDWLLRPHFTLWPSKTATCSVVGVSQSSHIPNPTTTGTDVTRLIDLKMRSKWKLYQSNEREASVGNYLSVIDMGM